MREVLTVSLGNHANHVNAHYWNFQDELAGIQHGTNAEVDHEVLFRTSEDASGETAYVPRVVMVDTKGSLGSLSRLGGTLYSDSPDPATSGYSSLSVGAMASAGVWGGGVQTVVQDRIPQSSYLQSLAAMDSQVEGGEAVPQDDVAGERSDEDVGDDPEQRGTDEPRGSVVQIADRDYAKAVAQELQETVKYWSDFLKVHIHPRSLHTLERVSRCDNFDCYAAGTEAFKDDLAIDEAVDACRRFLEECDLLQGFQILADTDTAWGGVAVELLEYLRDDYRATPMVAFATAEHGGFANPDGEKDGAENAAAERRRPLNAALSMVGLAEHASLVVPVHSTSFGGGTGAQAQHHIRFPTVVDYNTSSVTAAAIETATLPYRLLAHQRGRMSDMTSILTSASERRPIPLCSLEAQLSLDWCQLVLDVEGGSSPQQLPFDADLASRYVTNMFNSAPRSSTSSAQRDGRCGRHSASSFTPQFEEISQLLPANATWEAWNTDQLCDVYTVRGLDLRLRRGVAAPAASTAPERQHAFYARNRYSTFVGGTLPLPLSFPPVLHHRASDAHGNLASARGAVADAGGTADPVLGLEPEPEPEPGMELERDSPDHTDVLHEASVATRLTTAPAGLFSLVHASQQVVRATRAGQIPGMMAAVGGVGAGTEGVEQLGEVEEVLTSMRDCLYASLHVDSGEIECDDDY